MFNNWANPTSEAEADIIIKDAIRTIHGLSDDELELACKKLALFAGSFNHVWTSTRKNDLIDILVSVGVDAIDPVLQALVDLPRAEQFDITSLFIRKLGKLL